MYTVCSSTYYNVGTVLVYSYSIGVFYCSVFGLAEMFIRMVS